MPSPQTTAMMAGAILSMAAASSGAQASPEQRVRELRLTLPTPVEPFGTYVEAVQTGNLLFLSGMLPTEGRSAKFTGRVGAELDVQADGKRLNSRQSTPLQSRASIWDPWTK